MNKYSSLFLTIFAASFLLLSLGNLPLIDWDENIYAEASRQMLLRGNYLNVFINDYPFAEKPPLFFWLQTVSYHTFGINEFAARFPSAIAGIIMVLLCYRFGKYLHSARLGLIWGVVYLTSFLPAILGRAGVIDHTFNLFITASVFFLFLYGDYLQQRNVIKYLRYLLLASITMGLAVLTKGPLGGVIPLLCFAGYIWKQSHFKIRILHFIVCATISLSIATSWYITNIYLFGTDFIQGFIKFQNHLFTKSLEAHTGPWFYHILVAFFGIFPWTAILFGFKKQIISTFQSQKIAVFTVMSCIWLVFVLTLFGVVATKLPHYSSSIYIPLSFLVTIIIIYLMEHPDIKIPISIIYGFIVMGVSIGSAMIYFPYALEAFIQKQNCIVALNWSSWIAMSGVIIIIGSILAAYFFWKRKILVAVMGLSLMMLVFMQSFWHLQMPLLLQTTQKPLLELVDEVHAKQGKLVFYRFISFAALFYGQQPIEMLYTSKFPSNPKILENNDSEIYVITADQNATQKLLSTVKEIHFVKQKGVYSLYLIKKANLKSKKIGIL